MVTQEEFFRAMREAYHETREGKPDDDAIVFVMDNSTPMGREVSSAMPSVVLGLDSVHLEEIAIAGLPVRAALQILHDLERKHGASLSTLPSAPPGHFLALSFGRVRQCAPIPLR